MSAYMCINQLLLGKVATGDCVLQEYLYRGVLLKSYQKIQ